MARSGHELLTRYADQLAQALNRPAEQLTGQGLRAGDFRPALTFRFQDGSHATFNYALFIHDPVRQVVAVFTEHCGYFTFPQFLTVEQEGKKVFDMLP